MAPKNRKNSLPHFPSATGFTPQRKKFLDGTYKSYFAPGHKPDIIANPYTNPTDWKKTGAVLRMPQVVWLECRMHLTETITHNNSLVNASDQIISAAGTIDTLWTATGATTIYVLPGPPGFVPPPLPSSEQQDNLAMREKDRLMTIFNQVKTTIENMRSGRTWVQVTNWFDNSKLGQPGTVAGGNVIDDNGVTTPIMIVPFDHATVEYQARSGPTFTWYNCMAGFLESPQVTSTSYLGTNFLSVYCGNIFTSGAGNEGVLFLPNSTTPDLFMESSDFLNMYNAYKAADPLFYGLATRLFHPDLPWGPWTLSANDPEYHDQKISDYDTGSGTWTHDIVYQSLPLTFSTPTQMNAICQGNPPFTNSIFDQTAAKAVTDKLDITHPGGSSQITKSYLMNLIADHFKFNPDTGADLG